MTTLERRRRQRIYNTSPAGRARKARYQHGAKSLAYQQRYQAAYYVIVTRPKRRRAALCKSS